MRASAYIENKLLRQQGIALIIVMWTMVLLAVIASGFAFSMRNEALATSNAVSVAQARWLANGAVERTMYELAVPRLEMNAAWKPDGRVHAWQDGEAVVTVAAVDEGAFIDLNAASDELLKGLLTKIGGADDALAVSLVDAIADWRDEDDLKRPHGAEAADYKAAGRDYGPSNAPFQAVEELSMVLGMTPDLYARVAPFLTVNSRQSGANPRTAPREVLLSFPSVTEAMVDDYLLARQSALDSNQPLPPFPGGGGGSSSVWRIQARVEMVDGARFTRVAVIRQTGNPRRPFIALLWTEA